MGVEPGFSRGVRVVQVLMNPTRLRVEGRLPSRDYSDNYARNVNIGEISGHIVRIWLKNW
jgi:hypothetical protein